MSRCVFLHDTRLGCHFNTNSIRSVPFIFKAKGKGTKDTFYWPDMDRETVQSCYELDTGLPTCDQNYTIPASFSIRQGGGFHEMAIYSIWSHFVSLIVDINTPVDQLCANVPDLGNSRENKYIYGASRLPIFVELVDMGEKEDLYKEVPNTLSCIMTPQSDDDGDTSGCSTSESDSDSEGEIWCDFKELNDSTYRILGPDYFCETSFTIPAKVSKFVSVREKVDLNGLVCWSASKTQETA